MISFEIILTHLNLKLFIFVGILQVLKFEIQKSRILKILNFNPWILEDWFSGDEAHITE